MKKENEPSFRTLSDRQRIIGGFEFVYGTICYSGAIAFAFTVAQEKALQTGEIGLVALLQEPKIAIASLAVALLNTGCIGDGFRRLETGDDIARNKQIRKQLKK